MRYFRDQASVYRVLEDAANEDVLTEADVVSVATGLECKDPSLTVQSQSEDADINVLVRRFGLTGQIPVNLAVPMEEDFLDIFDYQSAQNALVAADRAFMSIPAEIRARFNNSAHELIQFCSNPANADELRKLGLANALPPVVPVPVPVVPAVPPA